MRLPTLIPFVATVACAHPMIESGGFTVGKKITEKSFETVENRAAFELRCPKERLQLVVLNVNPIETSWPSQIGVDGCGVRAVYVPTAGGWVMNTKNAR